MTVGEDATRQPQPTDDQGRVIEILLVEDSPSDAVMTVAALKETGTPHHLDVVTDGEAAMAYLRREGEYADRPRPDIILLDLNLPKKDGREVLREVKGDPDLSAIPIVVLTTSGAPPDILESYQEHANSYITKPVGFDAFLESVRGVERFWLHLSRLPHARS